MGKLKSPYKDLLPPLSKAEKSALAASIKADGVRDPIVVDEDGNILDGHHRYSIDKDAPRRTITGLSDAEKRAYVFQANFCRRNLSPEQKKQATKDMREIASQLRLADPKKYTQAAVAAMLGVTRGVVSQWFGGGGRGHNVTRNNMSAPDARVTIPAAAHADILAAVEAGDSAEQVAADYGVNPRTIRRIAEKERKKRERASELAEHAAAITDDEHTAMWEIHRGDCIKHLAAIRDVRLVFADPPYNIGIDYGQGKECDLLSDEKFVSWCEQWLALSRDALTADGSLLVMIQDEYAAELCVVLKRLGLHMRAWIKWYETFGVRRERNYHRTSRHILYFVKSRTKFVFNESAVTRQSDRQAKYNDARAVPTGKTWDDVWMIPRIVGTSDERIPRVPTQLPLAMLRAVVGCHSDPGDLVVDPFAGSGTTGVACIELGRRFIGIEQEKAFWDIARGRIASTKRAEAALQNGSRTSS